MALVVPNTSEVAMLNRLVGAASSGAQVMKLYKSGPVGISPFPDDDSTLAQFTECTASGYAAITITTAGWTASTSAGGTTTATYSPDAVYTFSTSETVFGYYVVDITSPTPNLLWAEAFSGGPFVLPSAGGQIQITPTVNLA